MECLPVRACSLQARLWQGPEEDDLEVFDYDRIDGRKIRQVCKVFEGRPGVYAIRCEEQASGMHFLTRDNGLMLVEPDQGLDLFEHLVGTRRANPMLCGAIPTRDEILAKRKATPVDANDDDANMKELERSRYGCSDDDDHETRQKRSTAGKSKQKRGRARVSLPRLQNRRLSKRSTKWSFHSRPYTMSLSTSRISRKRG